MGEYLSAANPTNREVTHLTHLNRQLWEWVGHTWQADQVASLIETSCNFWHDFYTRLFYLGLQ